jgi:hypothetical protein
MGIVYRAPGVPKIGFEIMEELRKHQGTGETLLFEKAMKGCIDKIPGRLEDIIDFDKVRIVDGGEFGSSGFWEPFVGRGSALVRISLLAGPKAVVIYDNSARITDAYKGEDKSEVLKIIRSSFVDSAAEALIGVYRESERYWA